MIGAIKTAELLPTELPWPIWLKVWIGFWLGIALFYAVLACQQEWAKRKAIQSEQSWHLRFSRVTAWPGMRTHEDTTARQMATHRKSDQSSVDGLECIADSPLKES